MLVVNQGEVAVIKAYVGLPTEDMSGAGFKFGSIVRPGHRGIWGEPLRTGKYAINPRCYEAEHVPTAILSLNWSQEVSQAHKLDEHLSQIVAKSREGFVFAIDLVVQIHVPDTTAPRVISMVGTIAALVNEVLQAAVGNHFRDKLQSMPAVQFIETRQQVQESALEHIREQLTQYEVETRGVYIQDVILPEQLVKVLTQREIANQEKATFQMQQEAQKLRIDLEKTKGTADMQAQLAQAQVGVEIAIADGPGPQESGRRRSHLHCRDRAGQGGRGGSGRTGPRQGLRGPGPGPGPGADGRHQRRHRAGRAGREDHARDPRPGRRRLAGRRGRHADEVPQRAAAPGGRSGRRPAAASAGAELERHNRRRTGAGIAPVPHAHRWRPVGLEAASGLFPPDAAGGLGVGFLVPEVCVYKALTLGHHVVVAPGGRAEHADRRNSIPRRFAARGGNTSRNRPWPTPTK